MQPYYNQDGVTITAVSQSRELNVKQTNPLSVSGYFPKIIAAPH